MTTIVLDIEKPVDIITQDFLIKPLIMTAVSYLRSHKEEAIALGASIIVGIALKYLTGPSYKQQLLDQAEDIRILSYLCEGYKGPKEDLSQFKDAVDRALGRNQRLACITKGAYMQLFGIEQKV
jgi:hypothetical protein